MRENNPPDTAPLAGLRLAVAGPGRVGASFAHWSVARGAELVTVTGRRRTTAEHQGLLDALRDAEHTAEWRPLDAFDPSTADVLLLTVSDPALDEVVERLVERPRAPVVLHASGPRDARALAPLADRSAVGSLHPLRAFASVSRRVEEAAGTHFAVDGDREALTLARRLAAAFGGHSFELAGERRVLYHLAATLAAGGVITVLSLVEAVMRAGDLPDELLSAYLALTRSALRPLEDGRRPVASAITGPAARGDRAMIEDHLRALEAAAPELVPSVRRLVEETTRRSRGKKE